MAVTTWSKMENLQSSTLDGAILAGDPTLDVQAGDAANFGAVEYEITIGDTSQGFEIVRGTNVAGDTITITRAQGGTAALGFDNATPVRMTVTVLYVTEVQDAVNNIEDGTTRLTSVTGDVDTDFILASDKDIIIHIDLDNDGAQNLLLRNGAGTDVLSCDESGNLQVDGTFTMDGAAILSGAATVGLLDITPTTINFGGGATVVDIGAGTGTTTVRNDFVVATNHRAHLGGSPIGWHMHAFRGAYTSSGVSMVAAGLAIRPAITGADGDTLWQATIASGIDAGSAVITQSNAETIGDVATMVLAEPDITKGTDTITNASTLYIASIPDEGASNWAIRCAAGDMDLFGNLFLGRGAVNDGRISFGSDEDVYIHNETADTELDVVATIFRVSGDLVITGNELTFPTAALSAIMAQESLNISADDAGGGAEGIAMLLNGVPITTYRDTAVYEDVGGKSGHTSIGGFCIRLTNTTGVVTVKGQVVICDTTTDDAVVLSGADEESSIGVFLEAGIADDAEAWVVVSGIADVAMQDNTSATHGNWVRSSVTEAGYADATNAGPPGGGVANLDIHMKEVGHCTETVAATGGGTHILARCALHFN